MEELLNKIFQEIIYYQPEVVAVEKKVSKEIDTILGKKQLQLSKVYLLLHNKRLP